ncbi:MAG: hypothetical protein Q8P59_11655, partial [Dehalococcoidia bacterium]|nr:hypothetical protein [Dehalococcoidia bacterium]
MHHEKMNQARTGLKMGLGLQHVEPGSLMGSAKGRFILDMQDAKTGARLLYRELDNIITRDGGILAARLFKDSQDPNSGQNNGLTMLAVGTGATGNLLSPDAPLNTQRRLNVEIARKAFASTQYRNADGVAVSYPTNVVDFTTTYGESEAVGPLNEMGL